MVAATEIFGKNGCFVFVLNDNLMLIEFHGDNKLLNQFVIMGDRSNNAIKLTFKVKGRKIWLSNGL